jgi:hypothetical protein
MATKGQVSGVSDSCSNHLLDRVIVVREKHVIRWCDDTRYVTLVRVIRKPVHDRCSRRASNHRDGVYVEAFSFEHDDQVERAVREGSEDRGECSTPIKRAKDAA